MCGATLVIMRAFHQEADAQRRRRASLSKSSLFAKSTRSALRCPCERYRQSSRAELERAT